MKWVIILVSLFLCSHANASVCVSFACVKAEAKGLPELADALKQWGNMLPQLNQDFHAGIQDDLLLMDRITQNAIEELDRLGERNISRTGSEAKAVITFAVTSINQAGEAALNKYKIALFETECSLESAAEIFTGRFPRWPFSRSIVKAKDFRGKTLKIRYDKNNVSGKKEAQYDLYTKIFESATDSTSITDLEKIAFNRQRVAYELHCSTRASYGIGKINDSHHFDYLYTARKDYQAIRTLKRTRI